MSEYPKAEIKLSAEGGKPSFRVMIGEWEIGSSKLRCDAELHMYKINAVIDAAFKAGLTYTERMRAEALQRELDLQTQLMKARSEIDKWRRENDLLDT